MKTIADVQPEKVEWLWKGWIPIGKVSILDGDPGNGKSLITLDLAARVTTGRNMPDGSPAPQGGVVFVCAEDDIADTLRPRLDAAFADCTQITDMRLVKAPNSSVFTLSKESLRHLEQVIMELGTVLVVIDPVMAFLPERCDTISDTDVRGVLSPLAELADRCRVAIVLVRHLNKDVKKPDTYRGTGSIAFIGLARSGMMVSRDEESGTLLMEVIKSNLAKRSFPLAYRIDEEDDVPRITWLGPTERRTKPDQVKSSPSQLAENFIRGMLHGRTLPSKELEEAALKAGIRKSTYDRVRKRIGVVAEQTAQGWVSHLPQNPRTSDIHPIEAPALTDFEYGHNVVNTLPQREADVMDTLWLTTEEARVDG